MIDAVLSGDKDRLLPLMRLEPVPCVTPANDGRVDNFRACQGDEAPGTIVQALLVSSCGTDEQHGLVRREKIDLGNGIVPPALFHRISSVQRVGPDYLVTLAASGVYPGGGPGFASVRIAHGLITSVNFGCKEEPSADATPVDLRPPP